MAPSPLRRDDRARRLLHRVLPGSAAALLLGSILLHSGPAQAFKLFGFSFFEPAKPIVPAEAQPYTVEVTVDTKDEGLADRLRGASLLYSGREDAPPPSTAAFISRARAEYQRILAALYGEAFYSGVITVTADGRPVDAIPLDARLARTVPVRITIDPGPPFTFGGVRISGRAPPTADPSDQVKNSPEKAGLQSGKSARAGIVINAEQGIVDEWRQQGHPKAKSTPRTVTADHPRSQLDVAIGVEPGPAAVYGPISVTGTQTMNPTFVARQSGIHPGSPYDPDDIERAQRYLRHLGVFSVTRVVEADTVNPDGTLPLTINAVEGPLHAVGAGVSYSSSDGAGVDGYYELRNLFGQAEHLRFEANVAGISGTDPKDFIFLGGVTFTKPGVITPMTDFIASLIASRVVYDPYTEELARARVGLTQEVAQGLTSSISINADAVHDDDNFGKRDFAVLGVPAEVAYDGTDNSLEPTRGVKAKLQLEPFEEFHYDSTVLSSRLDASAYYSPLSSGRLVIAGRVALGSLVGARQDEIPDGRLFFAGGGSSVRGYDFRSLGPTLPNGDVVGGRSLFESSIELRTKVTDSIGVVPFVDVGQAFANDVPDFKEPLKVGAGIGVRYYTGIGAIRADLAVPINPGRGDPAFALYLGIGEAF